MTLEKIIRGYWIVPHVSKILQNIWLTLIETTKNNFSCIRAFLYILWYLLIMTSDCFIHFKQLYKHEYLVFYEIGQ